MIPSIEKKQNIPFYLKVLTIYSNAILRNRTFLSWKSLETYLDDLIDIIKAQNIQYDCVVGIKTGGAIISDYVSNKLKLPNYKVKLSRSEYNCNKTPNHTINDAFHRQVLNNYGEYLLCEGIYDNLKGQNIILIDEMVSSGNTMNETIKYLRNEKHVNIIQPTCISFSKEKFKYDYKIEYSLPTLVFIWPWGYDN
jgi:hypoxanthine phosphoribosyltransferase